MVNYIPKRGDIVFLDFSPTLGHEKSGKRPALVLSNYDFNKNTNLIFCCPISTNTKYFPTHYELTKTKKIKGSVFIEHLRSLDYESRKVKFVESISNLELEQISELLNACF